MRSGWVVCVVLAGCIGSGEPTPSDLSGQDLEVAPRADLAGGVKGAIGSACTSDADCEDGTKPTCFVSTLFNQSDKLATPSGYCSSTCTTNAQCGANGACRVDPGQTKGWCFSACTSAADCRAEYACFLDPKPFCFPSMNLNCDPTYPGGTCHDAPQSNPGACIRAALGTGNVGVCNDSCTVGPGTCPASGGQSRQCIVIDATTDKGPGGASEGDTFHGTVCHVSLAPNADGAECAYQGHDYLDACTDGDECFLSSLYNGDNRCHTLCTTSGGASCPSGQTCQDVFGLLGSASPVGLCH
jgi:hypothetical protein